MEDDNESQHGRASAVEDRIPAPADGCAGRAEEAGPTEVLVVEDDEDYARFLEAAFTTSGEPFELYNASTLASAVEQLQRAPSDVILVDLNLPDSAGYDTFLRIRAYAPETPIIILTGEEPGASAVRAVKDGAEDYLVKALAPPEVIARTVGITLARRARHGGPPKRGTSSNVMAFIGSKGGVGATTVALNVAALAAQHGRTAFIEYASARETLPVRIAAIPNGNIFSLRAQHEFAPCNGGFDVRCCHEGLAETPEPISDLAAIVRSAARLYTNVILDLPSWIDRAVSSVLNTLDLVALVVDREPAAAHAGSLMMQRLLRAHVPAERVQLIAIDRTAVLSPVTRLDLRQQTGIEPAAVLPSATEDIALACSIRTPLVLLRPGAAFSVAVGDLTERLALAGAASDPSRFQDWIRQNSRQLGTDAFLG